MSHAARFLEGSIMRHVAVMASTSAIGLVAIFSVDLVNLLYLSLLRDKAVTAAIGFAGVVGFFQLSIMVGFVIGIGAVVSRSIGAGRDDEARRLAASSLVATFIASLIVAALSVAVVRPFVSLLGGRGETRELATAFVMITALSLPLLACGMAYSALLRSVGDARRAMNVTLVAAIATACLDPLLIFGLHLGFYGAAISTVLSRCVLAGIGWYGISRHNMVGRVVSARLLADTRLLFEVAGPAILTNLATPVASAFVTREMARFGTSAVAGQVTIDRISPVAFGLVFALTGAVGPIMAQNLGAARLDRVRRTLRDSLAFSAVAILLAWLVLAASQGLIVRAFAATGITASLIHLFCSVLALGFFGIGSLFVANAAFNNLGFPLLSTAFNWGRATLGTIPFVAIGARHGPQGILVGQAAGAMLFGFAAILMAFRVTARLQPLAMTAAMPNVVEAAHATGSGKAAAAALSARPALKDLAG